VKRSGRKSASQTPAPPSERIRGSRKNPKGSAASKESANKINVSDKIAETLSNKAKEYNEKHPRNKVTLATLKAVFRRGAGAYSSSHRPTISGGRPNSRSAWAFARVNKFLLKKGGTKVKAAYVQDDDLMENGGILDSSCKKYISQNESILKTGYYLNLNEFSSMIDPYGQIPLNLNFTLVTYNSGNQDGLSLTDTINPINLQNELAEILNIPLNNAQVVVGLYIEMGKKFKSISQIEGDNILVIDRDKIVCKSGKYHDIMEKGGEIGQEITCVNCGWHWNTNQSDESDKYVCHKCGFDNRTFYDSDPIGKYHLGGDMSKHLAPNGKPSNLTHEQWHLVRTPEFKAWFGDWENDPENASKVLDENGEPLVVYHGTPYGEFSVFSNSANGKIYFTTDKKLAKSHSSSYKWETEEYIIGNPIKSKIYEVFIDIKNPINPHYKQSYTNQIVYDEVGKIYKLYANNPNQIKLADGSNTTFDANNPDIRYEDGGKLFKPTMSVKQLSEKHNVSVAKISNQLIKGIKREMEHTTDEKVAKTIALHHIEENPEYYDIYTEDKLEDGGLVIAMEDGGVIDMYTQEKVKKVYVSIKIQNQIGRPQPFAPYEIKSVDEKVFQELADMKLLGVEGVSTSKYNIADWLSHRQCLVLMNFSEFTAINNDEQIEYDNVDYLTKDGFDILYRIYNKKEKTDRDYYGILQNLFPKIALEFELESKIVSGAKYKTYSYLESIFNQYRSGAFMRWFADQPRIQSVADMVDYTEKYLMSGQSRTDYTYFDTPSDLDKEDLKRIISRGIIRAIKVYTDESEVVLKDKTLNIPEGSRLIFVLGNYDNLKSVYQEMIQQYGLSEKYKINFVKEKDVVAYQQKKVVMQEKAFKQELEQKKLKVDAKIKKVLEQILNEAVEYFETKLVSEINERYTPPYTDYDDGTDYGDNPLAIPKFDEYYLSAISRFIEIYESEIPNIVATKNKYVFLDVFTRFERYIRDMKREVMQEEQVQIAEDRNYSRIYAETFYEAFVSLFSFSDFSMFINDIKEKIGVDLVLAYDTKDLMLKDGGEIEDEKKIALPDTYSKEENLKRVLNMQGYDLKKIGEEAEDANEDIMKKGGVVVGKSHQEADENGTGEKFVVASTGQIVELEGGEAVIVNKAIDADDEMEFEGEKMTPKQIASYLNHAYGGVKFEKGGELTCGCSNKKYYHGGELPSAVVNGLEGGEAVITKKTMDSKDKYTFQGQKLTPRQILSRINHKYGGVSFAKGGVTSSIKHSEENKGTKMMYFLNNVIYG